ncbi:hypothetical protein NCPPB940_30730 [Xanthomonas hortorum pv. taraxaci]|nr:hypothetical protein NCPPB940_30730 [Xanthomonas hortorum pv. taraxaci]CAD0345162.1 hypothetical protein NCPPB940_30730 [Xanthomonas hortorum pv. taraxaci]
MEMVAVGAAVWRKGRFWRIRAGMTEVVRYCGVKHGSFA